jgi:hypothetical protein
MLHRPALLFRKERDSMHTSRFQKRIGLSFGVFFALLGAGVSQAAMPPYDSVTQKVIDGIIDDGLILVKPGTRDVEPLIRKQLKYTLGQLNWEDAAPKLSWFKIDVEEIGSEDEDTGLVPVHYRARGHIAWSRKQEMPSDMELILPARGDSSGLKAFVDRYFHQCTNDPKAERRGYFFFFYPSLKTCPMSHPSEHELEREKGMVVRFPMRLEENDSNTSGKSPEYGKLWEDGKLTVTAIFGKYVANGPDSTDIGVQAYQRFYALLIRKYGQPRRIESTEAPSARGPLYSGIRLSWRLGERTLVVNLRLVPLVSRAGNSFLDWYAERTQDSDVLMYSGHAGLGDNIEALIKHAVFRPKKYQIFFVNGCDTFTYVDEDLFAAHQAATPGAPVTKYLDIITNVVSVEFARMADGSFTLLHELVKQKKNYHEILRKIDPEQRAIVDGEEDNTWPEPFRDWEN